MPTQGPNKGKCPKCEKIVRKVFIELVAGGPMNLPVYTLICPSCSTVLATFLSPAALDMLPRK